MAVNKVKVQVERVVQGVATKGGAEVRVRETQYRFEKRAAPACKTPAAYEGWSVFHVMRKELQCSLSEAKKQFIERRRFEAKKFAGKTQISVANFIILIIFIISGAVKNYVSKAIPNKVKPFVEKIDKMLTKPQKLETSTPKAPLLKTPFKEIANKISNEVPEKVELEMPISMAVEKPESEPNKTIYHQGKPIKVSKKAWKLENERKRQEKLRKLELDDSQAAQSNTLI